MRKYEINGNLVKLENYDIFKEYIGKTIKIFSSAFGSEIMGKYDLYIDNATQGSGHTPTINIVLGKYLIIKLGIKDFSNKEQIVFQFAHELCHYVFSSLQGLEITEADNEEENICTAMSLVAINEMFPEKINKWNDYISKGKEEKYNKGTQIAEEINFDIIKLKEKIYQKVNKFT